MNAELREKKLMMSASGEDSGLQPAYTRALQDAAICRGPATSVYTAMTTGDQISELIRASFPVDPLPDEFWLADVIRRPLDDIAEELQNRMAERSWLEITIRDWAMIGASPDVVRRYLTPNAFRYYLPSSLVGVLRVIGYVEWALDSILPNNQNRRPNG